MNDNVDDETRNGAAEENVTEANADVSPDSLHGNEQTL